MRKCCGCKGIEVAERDEAKPFDLSLLEVAERKVSLGFRAPRSGTKFGGSTFRASRGSLEFTVSILGGPYSDINGGREERIQNVSCGSRVVHEVVDLQPETEYTIRVALDASSAQSSASSSSPAVVAETLEVRTCNATTALFAGEDWGRSAAGKGKGKDGDDAEKDPKQGKVSSAAPTSYKDGASSSSGSAAWPAAAVGSAAGAARAGRGDSQDDVSTNAPSDTGDAARDEIVSVDSGSERAFPVQAAGELAAEDTAESSAPAAATVDEVTIHEGTPIKRLTECKLCSILDCLRMSKSQTPATDSHDLVVETRSVQATQASAAAASKAAPKRARRPYRIPFPGIPVDPASVGLMPRHDLA
mmetsp:Transcript_122215/g.215301  ORF Transcript_122215/g.215301 Transcript_122215/m.215301 type:complete len:360 (-) Transcript_122215:138-1217(-)